MQHKPYTFATATLLNARTLTCIFIVSGFVWGCMVMPVQAQYSYMNEEALSRLSENQTLPLDSIPVAEYKYYIIKDTSKLNARLRLYRRIGHIDNPDAGHKELVQLLNRNNPPLEYLEKGDTLIVPLSYEVDLRAYSPFPRVYEGALDFEKLVVIDKTLQAFAAYDYGKLIRWGPVSTGGLDSPTPSGRFNFNWRTKSRVSSLSPPDQRWLMRNVFNFHEGRGIHVHQYPLPLDGAVSHGCVRMSGVDSKWVYDWANGWKRKGTQVVKQGTPIIVIGEEHAEVQPFLFMADRPVLKMSALPADPYDVPPGTAQQRTFDRLRKKKQASR